MTDIDKLRGEVASVKTEIDGVRDEVHQVKTGMAVMKSDVETLKTNERDAKNARKVIHDKLDTILKIINQRLGAEGVRRSLRQWGWDTLKVLVGGVAGWLIKVFSG